MSEKLLTIGARAAMTTLANFQEGRLMRVFNDFKSEILLGRRPRYCQPCTISLTWYLTQDVGRNARLQDDTLNHGARWLVRGYDSRRKKCVLTGMLLTERHGFVDCLVFGRGTDGRRGGLSV